MWKNIQYRIRDYFAFTKSETKGFMGMIPFVAACLALPYVWQSWAAPTTDSSLTDKVRLDSMVADLEIRQPERKTRPRYQPPAVAEAHFFAFDPNSISVQQWQQLGLQPYLAERIIKYRGKGGKFRVKKDLQDIYGFPADHYARLKTYILLPDTLLRTAAFSPNRKDSDKPFPEKHQSFTAREDFRPHPFDLNTVDTTELEKLKGIGPALSRRIFQYRNRLGGFVSLDQLQEVYGLDSIVVKEVLHYASLHEPVSVKKINVNTATVEELKQHPYISPRLATVVVAYRQQHGPFADAQSLLKIKLLSASFLHRLEPYLAY
jgi:competence protein ComEA